MRRSPRLIRILQCVLSVTGAYHLAACSIPVTTVTVGSNSVQEDSYCSTPKAYSGAVSTASGIAYYKRRMFVASGLGGVDPTNFPIRYAEVVVTNAGGTTVQCAETDGSGNFSVTVPKDNGVYTVTINSRAFNTHLQTSILDNPTSNGFYSVATSFTANQTTVGGLVITANAKVDLKGGAFNIMDQILKANDFLRTLTAGCNSVFSGCTPFTVAPKSLVYWTPGFNPNEYLGDSTNTLSFYSMGTGRLFICGGKQGIVDSQDTDHFDNAVIVHEYGHFMEDLYGRSESPGGRHSGQFPIDPRLAWSEGFADFFGTAVLGDQVYRDTSGNTDGTTMYLVIQNFDSTVSSGPGQTRDLPTPGMPGEGNFREFAITRALWDIFGSTAANYPIPDFDGIAAAAPFAEFWTSFIGWRNSSDHFRDYGLFMKNRAALPGARNIATELNNEEQRADRHDYATTYTLSASACTYDLQPYQLIPSSFDDGGFSLSNPFASNDFYDYDHPGGPVTFSLDYVKSPSDTSSLPVADLDLYIYNSGYSYGNSSTMAGYSNTVRCQSGCTVPATCACENGHEQVSSANLPAGHYMINVMAYTAWDAAHPGPWAVTQYSLKANGSYICP